jgi:hypothetical protein
MWHHPRRRAQNAPRGNLFTDCTAITTWHADDAIVARGLDEPSHVNPISQQIWPVQAQNESKLVAYRALDHISRDYFRHVVCSHRFKHSNYGAVHFGEQMNFEIARRDVGHVA